MTAGTVLETTPTATLSRQDRCDRCGARAYVKATLGDDLELLFCGHHFRDHEIKLRRLWRGHPGRAAPDRRAARGRLASA